MGLEFDDFVELGFSAADFEDVDPSELNDDDSTKKGLPADNVFFNFEEEEAKLLKIANELEEEEKKDKKSAKQSEDEDEEEDDDDEEKAKDDVKAKTAVALDFSIESDKLSNLVDYLKTSNLIKLNDDFKVEEDSTLEEFFENLMLANEENIIKEAKDSLFSSLPEDWKLAVKFGLTNKGASFNDFIDQYNETISATKGELDLAEIDLEEEEQQEILYKHYLKNTTKYSDDKIKKQIEFLKKNGELYGEAKEALTELVALEAQAKIDFDRYQEEVRTQTEAFEKQFRNSVTEAIKNSKEIEPERAKKIANFVNNKIKLESGVETNLLWKTVMEIGQKPEHLVQLADLVLDYDSKKGFNVERFIALGKTQKTKEVIKQIDDSSKNKSPGGNPRQRSKAQFDWEKWALGEI